ncbi:MAG: CBS domain-containing protein, partial [Lentisphaeria bacterium]|nr:CBS domain-containing protein [Lentisphaeria bacterium]
VREALCKMGHARCGSAIVVDNENHLLGVFTDGDFRRAAEKDINVLTRNMSEVMTANPVAVDSEALAVEVVRVVEKHKISDIIVIDSERKVVGLIDVQDLPGLKLM